MYTPDGVAGLHPVGVASGSPETSPPNHNMNEIFGESIANTMNHDFNFNDNDNEKDEPDDNKEFNDSAYDVTEALVNNNTDKICTWISEPPEGDKGLIAGNNIVYFYETGW